MNPIETNEGVNAAEEFQDIELITWLKSNRLLKVKQKFIENEVTMDDLKAIDLNIELNDFITKDLGLSGISATKARKAIIALQQKCDTRPSQQPQQILRTVILSKEEDEAMTAINIKCAEATEYMQQLNNDINILNNTGKENKNKINEFENEVINKVKMRMNEIRQKLNKEINVKKEKITSHLNKIKSYHSTLSNAQKNQQKLLNDVNLNALKRKTKIQEIFYCTVQNKTMDNKPNFTPLVTVHFNEKKTYNFIKQIGTVQKHKYPDPPFFFVKNIKNSSATIEFRELKQSLECVVEIDKCTDNEDDEKKTDWKQLATLKNKKSYTVKNLDRNTSYKLRAKCKNEYGWSHHSEIIKFKTENNGKPYHPKGTKKYHPQGLTKGHKGSIIKSHPGSLSDESSWRRTWSCCGGHTKSDGCVERYLCCKQSINSNGCTFYYPCCKNANNHSGCKEKYLCCGQAVSSKGCQFKST